MPQTFEEAVDEYCDSAIDKPNYWVTAIKKDFLRPDSLARRFWDTAIASQRAEIERERHRTNIARIQLFRAEAVVEAARSLYDGLSDTIAFEARRPDFERLRAALAALENKEEK